MTGRLIDADAQIEQEKFFAETFKGDFGEQVALHTIEILKNAPTVDAEPVIHGHWNGIEMDSRGYTDIFECSECKCYVRTPFMMKVMEYDFCPSCGAKMDAQEDEE